LAENYKKYKEEEKTPGSAPVYKGSYEQELKNVYDGIANRPDFSYDMGADPIYRQYKSDYARQGRMAMKDTMGQASALTGGYASSYAQSVGQQQYDAYLRQLNEVVPELYGMAYKMYQDEGDQLKDLYGMDSTIPMSEWTIIRDIPAVPETVPMMKLLEVMQENRTEITVVVDEHGGTAGIVTMSDIMEQIVGRIDDEYLHEAEDSVVTLADGSLLVDGSLPVGELEELIGFEPEESDECETAGGLLLVLFDRIPKAGDMVTLDHAKAHVVFTVMDMDRLRIDKIRVEIEREEEE